MNLPRETFPLDLAYSSSGTLALALIPVDSPESNSGLFEITATGLTRFVHVTEPIAVVARGDSFVVEPGLRLVTGGRVSDLVSASKLAAKGVHVSVGPLASGGGSVFVGTDSGLAVLRGAYIATVTLPTTTQCSTVSLPPPGSAPPTTQPKDVRCPQTALDLVATPAGGVYFWDWSPGVTLVYLAASPVITTAPLADVVRGRLLMAGGPAGTYGRPVPGTVVLRTQQGKRFTAKAARDGSWTAAVPAGRYQIAGEGCSLARTKWTTLGPGHPQTGIVAWAGCRDS